MSRPRHTYDDDKRYALNLVVGFLRDTRSGVDYSVLSRYLHRRSLETLLPVVLRDLEAEGVIEFAKDIGVIYLLDKPPSSVV